jgi:multisubunit Na+/H+ antiporter MnhC subunit
MIVNFCDLSMFFCLISFLIFILSAILEWNENFVKYLLITSIILLAAVIVLLVFGSIEKDIFPIIRSVYDNYRRIK